MVPQGNCVAAAHEGQEDRVWEARDSLQLFFPTSMTNSQDEWKTTWWGKPGSVMKERSKVRNGSRDPQWRVWRQQLK